MINGIINVYKEAGYTSFDVVARLRGILRIKKIGHTGTLDPDAVGVLPVCVGNATKICDVLTDTDKQYKCTMLLGVKTDTFDTSGRTINEADVSVSKEDIINAVNSFIGDIKQIPPMYSAIKVNGKKLYEYARSGQSVELKERAVSIYNINIEDISIPYVTFTVDCSKGTYIRSLCNDIGEKLGCFGTMASLTRTKVGKFTIDESIKLNDIEEMMKSNTLLDKFLPVDKYFDSYKSIIVNEITGNKKAVNGSLIEKEDLSEEYKLKNGELVKVYTSDLRFVGLFETKNNRLKVKKMFLQNGNN